MGATLSTISQGLKTVYQDGIKEQLENQVILYGNLKKNVGIKSSDGKTVTLAVRTGRNTGVGARAEGGQLPTAGNQAYKNPVVTLRYLYARAKITGQVMKLAKSNKAAFANMIEEEMAGMERDMIHDVNRQWFGRGTGLICLANGAGTGTTTLTLDTPTVGATATQHLYAGQKIDIFTSETAGVQEVDSATIASVDSATQVTLSTAQTWSDNSFVFFEDARANEMEGLLSIVDDGGIAATFEGITRSSSLFWQATDNNNSGTLRNISDILMQTVFLSTEKQEKGGVDLIIAPYEVQNAYGRLLESDKRFVGSDLLNLKGGFTALDFNGKAFIADQDCTNNHVYFLNRGSLSVEQASDPMFMDEDGSIFSRVAGEDAYEATMLWYAQLACSRVNANGVLRDVQ